MNWLYYLGEANLYLTVFYLCYCLFLNRETHYTLNRIYLLFSCIIAFVLPLLQVGILKPVEAIVQKPVSILAADVVYAVSPAQIVSVQPTPIVQASHFTLQDGILYTYLLGACVLVVLLAIKLYKLAILSRANYTLSDDGYKLIYINESNTAFSFFNYLFLGTNTPGAPLIIKHELVHINQKHSIDILFLELFKIVNWFNPMIYLLQNSLKTVHEYIADEQTAINKGDAISYSSFLVDNAYGISGSSITHSFFNYNLLKKRIIMLNQQRSGNLARLKYLIALPLCAAFLCTSTLGFSKTYGWVDLAPRHMMIVKKPTTHFRKNPSATSQPKPNIDMVKFTEPSGYKKDYRHFFTSFYSKVHYPVNHLKSAQGAMVTVKFTITADHKLANPVIAKSGGADFDKAALSGFQYEGTLSDKPGEHNFIIRFYPDAKSANSSTAAYEMPGLEGIIAVPAVSKGKFMPPIVMPAPQPSKPKITRVKFPPPVVKPQITSVNNPASQATIPKPPATNQMVVMNNPDNEIDAVKMLSSSRGQITGPTSIEPDKKLPLIVVNGERYNLKEPLKPGQQLYIIAADSLISYKPGNEYAKAKWGTDADNGVIALFGKTSLVVR